MAPLEADCQIPMQRQTSRWASTWPDQPHSHVPVQPDGMLGLEEHFAPVGTRGISLDGFYSERKVQSCPIPELARAGEDYEETLEAKELLNSARSKQPQINARLPTFDTEAEDRFAPVGTRGISLDGFYSERKVQSLPIASLADLATEWSEGEEEEENKEPEESKGPKAAECSGTGNERAASGQPSELQSPPSLLIPAKQECDGFLAGLPLYHISQVTPETPRETSRSRSCSVDSAQPASSTSAGSHATRSSASRQHGSRGGAYLTADQFLVLQASQEDLIRQNAELMARIEQLETAAQKSVTSTTTCELEREAAAAEYFDISDDAEHDESSTSKCLEQIFSTDSDAGFETLHGESMQPPDTAASSYPLSRLPVSSVPDHAGRMADCMRLTSNTSQAWRGPVLTGLIPPPPTAAPVLSHHVLSDAQAPPASTPSFLPERPPPMSLVPPEIYSPALELPAHIHASMRAAGMPGCFPPPPAPTQTFPPAPTCFQPASAQAAGSMLAAQTVMMMPSGPPAPAVLPPRVPAPPCLSLAAQLQDPQPDIRSAQCPSAGSVEHFRGRCKPCAFFRARGCENGKDCKFCHLCPAGEKKRRQRDLCEAGKARSHLWRMAVAEAYAAEAARQAAACKDEYPEAFRR